MGKARKQQNAAAIADFSRALRDRKNRSLFLGFQAYNDAKRFARFECGVSGFIVDNGSRFQNLVNKALDQNFANDRQLHSKWRDLKAANRAAREARNNARSKLTQNSGGASNRRRDPLEAPLGASWPLVPAKNASATAMQNVLPSATAVGAAVRDNNDNDDTSRYKVLYAKTDNTPGYKEFGCVVVETNESEIRYHGDVYEPAEGCCYRVLYEIEDSALRRLIDEENSNNFKNNDDSTKDGSTYCERPNGRGWVSPRLRKLVLRAWKNGKTG